MQKPPKTPFRRRDVLAAGVTASTFRSWTRRNEIRRVLHGVYVPQNLTDTLDLRAACAALALPPHCAVVERSAAWLHGLDLHDPGERHRVPDLEVVSLRNHPEVRRRGVYSGIRDLKPRDLMQLGDVWVTTPVRTALDLACLRGIQPALAALDAFMRRFELSQLDFEQELPRFRRRRGVVQLRRLIPLATPLAESTGESWLRATLIQHGFEPPEPQIEFWQNGRLVAKADMGYRHLRIAIEYFGDEFHGADEEDHDNSRIAWLEARGWLVLVVRKEDLSGPQLEAFLRTLSQAIVDRSRPRGKRRYPRGERLNR